MYQSGANISHRESRLLIKTRCLSKRSIVPQAEDMNLMPEVQIQILGAATQVLGIDNHNGALYPYTV